MSATAEEEITLDGAGVLRALTMDPPVQPTFPGFGVIVGPRIAPSPSDCDAERLKRDGHTPHNPVGLQLLRHAPKALVRTGIIEGSGRSFD
jgi:hypothetical protein